MAKWDKYHTDYMKLYSEGSLTPEIITVLKKSDRKMKYMEEDLKRGAFVQNQKKRIAKFLPSREDSLDRLIDEANAQFPDAAPSPEEAVIHADEIQRLQKAVAQLPPEERALISALFFNEMSQRTYARKIGVSQASVSYRKLAIQRKLKKLLGV